MITVENITRKYGEFTAVKGVSFSIAKGEIVGLLGHNGAGKTTTIKVLTGFLEPTSGRVLIDGIDIAENRLAVQRKIGYLPESVPLYPEMSVLHYLDYVCDLRGINESSKPALIREAVEKTGLAVKVHALVSTLSKGYKQRVGVAQAIMHRPEIVILDEPTSGLDPSQIHEMRNLITTLSKSSTVILSTHILQEVEAVCSRVIIILQGEIAADSKLEDLRDSNRLLLTTNQSPEVVKSVLAGLDGVRGVKSMGRENGHAAYALELSGESKSVAPRVAKTVVDRGWELVNLEQERRNLETIFREINAGQRGGAHGN